MARRPARNRTRPRLERARYRISPGLRDALIDEGHTSHHLLNESGWTTFYIETVDDYDHARCLVRLSYLYHVAAVKKTPAGAEEYAAVDVESEA